MKQKEVAVLLATYQGEKYISEQLESLKKQSFQDFVCYIHDDGSTDGTMSIVKQFVESDPEHFVVLDYPVCGGAKNNFMSMSERVKAPYIMFCDQDDYWLENKIELSLKRMKETEIKSHGPVAVYTEMKIVDSNLNTICDSFAKYSGRDPQKCSVKDLLMQNIIPGCSIMINHELQKLCNGLMNIDNIPMHDWWILVVAAAYGVISRIDEPLMLYRQHINNEVGAPSERKLGDHIKNFCNEFVTGKLIKKKKIWIDMPRKMARELILLPNFPSEKYQEIVDFAYIEKESKIKRMRFYYKHQFRTDKPQYWLLLWV